MSPMLYSLLFLPNVPVKMLGPQRAQGLNTRKQEPDREIPGRERPSCCLPSLSPPQNKNMSGREIPVQNKGDTRGGVAPHVYSSKQRWIRRRAGQSSQDKHGRRKRGASRKHLLIEATDTGKSSTIVAVPIIPSSRINNIDVATQEDGTRWSGSCCTDDSETRYRTSSASFRSSEGSGGSVNTVVNTTVGTPTDCVGEAFPLQQVISGIEVDSGDMGVFVGAGTQMKGLNMIERTVFESWKGLPWQARLCPRAIEEQETARRALALEKEVKLNPLTLLRSCVPPYMFS